MRVLTAVFVWPAEEAEVAAARLLVLSDGLVGLPKATGVHPLLARPLALEHLLLLAAVVGVVGLAADTVDFKVLIGCLPALRLRVQQSVSV